METTGPLLCAQELATGPYLELDPRNQSTSEVLNNIFHTIFYCKELLHPVRPTRWRTTALLSATAYSIYLPVS
jgi:hypothetical protein